MKSLKKLGTENSTSYFRSKWLAKLFDSWYDIENGPRGAGIKGAHDCGDGTLIKVPSWSELCHFGVIHLKIPEELPHCFLLKICKDVCQHIPNICTCFLYLARSKLRLCSANHRAGYFSNLDCDWLSIVWAYSEQSTENGPWLLAYYNEIRLPSLILRLASIRSRRMLSRVSSTIFSWTFSSATSRRATSFWFWRSIIWLLRSFTSFSWAILEFKCKSFTLSACLGWWLYLLMTNAGIQMQKFYFICLPWVMALSPHDQCWNSNAKVLFYLLALDYGFISSWPMLEFKCRRPQKTDINHLPKQDLIQVWLTHWGRMTHIRMIKICIILCCHSSLKS